MIRREATKLILGAMLMPLAVLFRVPEAVAVDLAHAEFVRQAYFSVADIARWFRMPQTKLVDLEQFMLQGQVRRARFEAEQQAYVDDVLVPWANERNGRATNGVD